MTKTIKYLLLSLICVFSLCTLFICNIKLDVSNTCQFIITKENPTFVTNKKLHKYLNEQEIHKCSIKFEDHRYYAYLQFKEKYDSSYFYWISFEAALTIENGTYLMNVHFNSLTIIKYLYYFGIN